ncbi:ATP-dependent nuclease [Rhodococcus globerulus]|uniref:ATP-dependent nuclease n=1 Tax=Rhodococcus globerulus TaxID=33008 RepID=UPI000B07F1CD|nr:AAA family ATPase [Rhodococcus globerulus]
MHLSEIRIENFRQFGSDEDACTIPFGKGVTALVGENDSGKSTVIDAIRYALLTRDGEYIKVVPEDFHIDSDGRESDFISIRCKLSELSPSEQGSFAEYLTFEFESGSTELYLNWHVRKLGDSPTARRWIDMSTTSGLSGEGPTFDALARQLLSAAYLRPLRDAARELSPGRGSRLSQILSKFSEITLGEMFKPKSPPQDNEQANALSLAGMTDYLRYLVNQHSGISAAEASVNDDFLTELTLADSGITGRINFAEGGSESARLRQILERLELALRDEDSSSSQGNYGLGSNNLLFMACELLLLGKENDGLPLLLVEEPEAHLHPQRQLRLMEFLQKVSRQPAADSVAIRPVQTIVTTHSPNLASKIPLEDVVLLRGRRAFSLAPEHTMLASSDYRFLERFLDTTKANLFFSHGLLIVEGDAEAILLPTISRLIGMDLTKYGTSIVNVGSVGLYRYSRILQRSNKEGSTLDIPVACLADLDVMPDCAPEILGKVDGPDDDKWTNPNRRWKAKKDFTPETLESRISNLKSGDAQNVKTFVADEWTFEYALAYSGLANEMLAAVRLAIADDKINNSTRDREKIQKEALAEYNSMIDAKKSSEQICSIIMSQFGSGNNKASKAITAQYMAEILIESVKDNELTAESLKEKLPTYIIDALSYATGSLISTPGDDAS